jgi:two-component system phosphate regulon sensor histidine kinase PhoR
MVHLFSTSQSKVSVARDLQSYRNIGYLCLSFVSGLIYFAILVPGILLALTTLTIWIGVPLSWGLLVLWWQCAAFERALAIGCLRVQIAPLPSGTSLRNGWWPDFQARLSNSMTWKTLAFLLLKLPVGLCCFTLTVTLLSLCPGLMVIGLTLGIVTAPCYALVLAMLDRPDPRQRLRGYLVFSASAFGLNLLSFSLLNGLAWLQGQLARGLLGMSETARRLQEAKAWAEQERVRAEQAERRRRELVVNVSHELRAPVASICGHLESLLLSTQEGVNLPEPQVLHEYLNVAHQEARRLGLLVDDLLSLARMESHELSLDIRATSASEVLEEVYHTLMPLAQRERQVRLVRGAQPHLPPVQADRQRLIQVLTNLVRNAITSTPAGGIVSLSLERTDPQHLALIVEDNGVGIPADELPHIFDRFYRTDTSRSRTTGGFGLGLAIVHDLVHAMGGSISVESTVGQGSRFSVRLQTGT